jgi:L-ascorbate metabolism protein UlaG (beta-lactamase superfamily)
MLGAFCSSLLCAVSVESAELPPSDTIPAENGNIKIQPVNHASLVLSWNGKDIFIDPVGDAKKYPGKAGLIFITDIHGDHFDPKTLHGLVQPETKLIVPKAVEEKLPADLKKDAIVISNGEKKEIEGISIEAVPMYNLTPERLKFHTKGRGNGYVLTLGGKRFYISGDTEDIPEMRGLKNIDVAFLCMNLPYTMTVEQAADAVKAFKPKIVYPYHYRGSDLGKFKQLVGDSAEVRVRDWYMK